MGRREGEREGGRERMDKKSAGGMVEMSEGGRVHGGSMEGKRRSRTLDY